MSSIHARRPTMPNPSTPQGLLRAIPVRPSGRRLAPLPRTSRRAMAPVDALAVPPGLGRAIATPMLATGHYLLKDPNIALGLSAMLGAVTMEVARHQAKMRRVASVVLAVTSPVAMRFAVEGLMTHLGIDAARVPMQAILDTSLAAIAGTSVALMSTLMRPPWAPGCPAAIEGPAAPLVARFVFAAALGPVLFHTLMAASLPTLVQNTVRLVPYAIHSAFMIAANL